MVAFFEQTRRVDQLDVIPPEKLRGIPENSNFSSTTPKVRFVVRDNGIFDGRVIRNLESLGAPIEALRYVSYPKPREGH